MPNFHICKVINIAYDIQDSAGHVRFTSVADIPFLITPEYIISMLPNMKAFGWACKYIYDPFLMPH